MANLDGIFGIGGDRDFMDYLYLYYKKKNDLLNDTNKPKDELKEEEGELYSYYLQAIWHCLSRISQLENCATQHFYLDWLRWNLDVILNEVLHFENVNTKEDAKQCIEAAKQAIMQTFRTHFQLTEIEKAISNQYVHSYELINRSGRLKKTVIINTGKIFINYVDLLKKRYYIENLDRENVTFAQLNAEADFLVEKLKGDNYDLSLGTRVEYMKVMYENFRSMDRELRIKDDENIKLALEIAHQRATESFIQSVKRKTFEAISQLKQKLIEKMNRAWEAAIVVLNPKQTMESFLNFLEHPIDSITGVLKWANENPWKCTAIVLRGVLMGAAVGIGVSYAAPHILASSFASLLPSYATVGLTAMSGSFIGSSIVGGIAGGLFPLSLVGGNIIALKKEENRTQQEIELKERMGDGELARNEEAGKCIANKYLFEADKREFLKKHNSASEYFRRYQQEEQSLISARDGQFENMTAEELDETQRNLLEYVKELEEELQRTKAALGQGQSDTLQKQSDIVKVKEGMDALSRLMHNTNVETNSIE